MIDILMASSAKEALAELTRYLRARPDVALICARTGSRALKHVRAHRYGLIIVDEQLDDLTGVALARELVAADPRTNLALVSGLAAEDFHKASEGLGILAQLPAKPTQAHGRDLIGGLETILSLTQQRNT